MKEIKFRVWDKENKEMLDVEYLHWDDCTKEFSIRTTMYTDYFDEQDMILMQFTGLHDKNGKEIYEGDIVEIDKDVAKTFGIYSKGIINYLNGGFIVTKNDGSYETIKSALLVLGDLNNIFRGKIIGNVWEDGDLLNDSQNTKTN